MNAIGRFVFNRAVTAPSWARSWRMAVVVGRICFSAIFIMSGIVKVVNWSSTVALLDSYGISASTEMLGIATAVELLGGLSILTGTFARLGALGLAIYLIPVTAIMHAFWNFEGAEQQAQLVHFLKNICIFGGLLVMTAVGAATASVDEKISNNHE